ncbi:efflux RND transporter periplasmic adaptor subunit [Flavobacteriaceae sp. LMIT009]
MKKIFSLLIIAIVLISCGGGEKNKSVESIIASGDLATIKSKKSEVEKAQLELSNQLDLLNAEIEKLDTNKKLSQITTFKAKEETFNHFLELQGSVSTKQNLVIFPEYSGVLSNVYVREGQRVSTGQLLAKIDDGGLGQQLAQLQIQADLAKTTFERQERLWNQKIGSEIQYLQAKSTFEAQEKAVNQMKSQLAKTEVRAPFSGTIDDVITEQGSVVAPGSSQLMRIVNLKDMYIETAVPEAYLTSVTNGKTVKVEFPVLGKEVDAKIRQAGSFINPANRTFKVEVDVPNKDGMVKPNLTAKLKINDYTNNKAIMIPLSVISENAQGQQYVYIVEELDGNNVGKTKRVIIETGRSQGDNIEILSGLEIGMDIVEEGARSVKEGQDVEIINE